MNFRQTKIRRCLSRVLDPFVQGPESNGDIGTIRKTTAGVLIRFGRKPLILFSIENDTLDGAFLKIIPLNGYTDRLLGGSLEVSRWKQERKRSIHTYLEMEMSALMNKAERQLTREEFSNWIRAVSEEMKTYRGRKT